MKNFFSEIPKRSAILILGPPGSDKNNILYKVVSEALENKKVVLFITTDYFPKHIEDLMKKNNTVIEKYKKEGYLKFIDCYSAQVNDVLVNNNIVKMISGPLALNDISVALAEFENYFYKKNMEQYVIFQSLSTLLIYSTPEAIERFIHVIIARTKNTNSSIFFTLEQGMHDNKVIAGIEHLMDGIIIVDSNKTKLKLF